MENIEFIYRFSIEGPLEDASRKLVTGYLWQIDGLLSRATKLLQKTLPENVRVACSLDGTGQDAINDQEEMIRLQADEDCLPLYAEVPAATIERIQAAGHGITDRRTVQL